MKRISLVLLSAMVLLAACKDSTPFKKASDGTEYKIIAAKGGKLITGGNFMEIDMAAKYNDSALFSTADDAAPQFIPYDTTQFPPLYKEIFKNIHIGDSIVIKTAVDSLIKKNMADTSFMKKGAFLYQTFKIVNSYASEADVEKAKKAASVKAEARQKEKSASRGKDDDKALTDYFAKNNIKATKTANGTYVEILQAGTGAMIDTSVVAKINYTGKLLSGKVFDSNTDPAKGHLEPLPVNLTSNPNLGISVIPGMMEGLKLLNKGAKARLYIPSGQGYGPRGNGPDLPANANLIFDIEVLDLLNGTQAASEAAVMQKKMMDMQKKYQDSMSKMQGQQAPSAQGQK